MNARNIGAFAWRRDQRAERCQRSPSALWRLRSDHASLVGEFCILFRQLATRATLGRWPHFLTARTSGMLPQKGHGAFLQRSSHMAESRHVGHGEGRRNLTLSQHLMVVHHGSERFQLRQLSRSLLTQTVVRQMVRGCEMVLFQQSPVGSPS